MKLNLRTKHQAQANQNHNSNNQITLSSQYNPYNHLQAAQTPKQERNYQLLILISSGIGPSSTAQPNLGTIRTSELSDFSSFPEPVSASLRTKPRMKITNAENCYQFKQTRLDLARIFFPDYQLHFPLRKTPSLLNALRLVLFVYGGLCLWIFPVFICEGANQCYWVGSALALSFG